MKKDIHIPTYHAAKDYRNNVAAKMLHKIPVTGMLDIIKKDEDMHAYFSISDVGSINGHVASTSEGLVGYVADFRVRNAYRGKGLGTRIMKVFVAELKNLEVRKLYSDSISTAALLTRAHVFGKDSLYFYDYQWPEFGTLPINYEQALATNARIEANRPAGASPYDSPFIGAFVDLGAVDVSSWERAELEIREYDD